MHTYTYTNTHTNTHTYTRSAHLKMAVMDKYGGSATALDQIDTLNGMPEIPFIGPIMKGQFPFEQMLETHRSEIL